MVMCVSIQAPVSMKVLLLILLPITTSGIELKSHDEPLADEPLAEEPLAEQQSVLQPPQELTQDTGIPSRQLLFIGVFTAASNVEQRDEIRASWMQHELLKREDAAVSAKFLLGSSPDPEGGEYDMEAISREMGENGDMLQLDCPEGYHNLPKKSVSFFRWFALNGNTEFVMKLDDDTFPNLDMIIPLLDLKVANEKYYTYLGNFLTHRRPMDHGKWKQNTDHYSAVYYPKYAAGPGYILRQDLCRLVYKDHYDEHLKYAMLDNEDANTGVWINRENNSGVPVDYQRMEADESQCKPIYALAMNVAPGIMSCMWSRKMAGERDLCCDYEYRDWKVRLGDANDQASLLRGHGMMSDKTDHAHLLRGHGIPRKSHIPKNHRSAPFLRLDSSAGRAAFLSLEAAV